MTYYFLNGEYIARRSNPPTKDQIYNDPRFAPVRANTKEFGGASVLSKAIRTGLGENERMFKDIRFASRLSGNPIAQRWSTHLSFGAAAVRQLRPAAKQTRFAGRVSTHAF